MLNKVKSYIKSHKLLNHNNLYVVALSGGADSVALLLLLDEMGYNVHAAHCNFNLRGGESERDERFCVALCNRLGIQLHRAHFDTRTYAELHKVSIEMAARELRYSYFEQLRNDVGAAAICVAHHRDDSVETVLINLIRGTGVRGLCGIRPKNGHIVRPLLCVSRDEIEAFLKSHNQEYVTDSTNLIDDVVRNKIRLNVIPLLKTINPAATKNIQQTSENLEEALCILDTITSNYNSSNELVLSELNRYGSREYFVYEWLKNYGFNGTQVKQLLESETGRIFTSAQGFDVLSDRGRLIVEPALEPLKPVRIPEDGVYVIDQKTKMAVNRCEPEISKQANCATVDAAKVGFPLTVRRVEQGDWMIPYGMKGRKLLSDLMTDCKMSLFEKRRQLVVTDVDGQIIWLVGIRTDSRYSVDCSSKQVLKIEVKSE